MNFLCLYNAYSLLATLLVSLISFSCADCATYEINHLISLQLLYDYMDPDKDTYQTRDLTKKELLDNEYWLLQKVEKFLDKANYFEIPKHQLVGLLHDRDTEGLILSVDPSDYELLKIWTRGKAAERRSHFQRLKMFVRSYISRNTPSVSYNSNSEYDVYTRVFVAVRSRGEKKLFLKVFKEVPCSKLEYLLPDGKIKMSNFDKGFIATSVLLGGATVALRSLPAIADLIKVQWTWLGVGLAGILAARAWIGYKNKRNHYLANLATTLYYKTVANNRGVLTLLADRAQDEEFKEALLAYVFLLSPRNRRGVPGTSHTAESPIYDSQESLKIRIEEWLSARFNLTEVGFDIEDALEKLDNLGLLVQRKDGTLTVQGIEDSLAVLPESYYRWQAVGALRDSENSDEQVTFEEVSQQHGWR